MAFRTATPSTVMRASTVAFASASEFAKSEISSSDVSPMNYSMLPFHFTFYDRFSKDSCSSCFTMTPVNNDNAIGSLSRWLSSPKHTVHIAPRQSSCSAA